MSGMRQVEVGMGFTQRTPPEAVLAEGVPALLESVPPERRKAAIELAHWGYGAAAGTVFALLPRRVRRWRLAGPVFGVAVWSAYELGVAPALGLAHARRHRPQERWAFLFDHVVFGLMVGEPPETVVAGTGGSGDGPEEGRCCGGHGGHGGQGRTGAAGGRKGHRERRGRGGRREQREHRGHGSHCGHGDHEHPGKHGGNGGHEGHGDHGKHDDHGKHGDCGEHGRRKKRHRP
ncbi:hypothetical protein [Nocardiopsis deserti]|uniref:hypothetical protein n=1 Tax=Nocardiopsis deserti TaxID=2605988 RepID=UPI0029585FC8|nr:hypothetical protein [Nocardiopsis deserti]